MFSSHGLRIVVVVCGASAFALACLIPFALQAGGVKLGPDAPIQLVQGKSGNGGKGGDPPGPPITPPGQGGTPPGQQKGGASTPAPAGTADHGSGVHGAHGRDSGTFGTPSGQRGTGEVPEGR